MAFAKGGRELPRVGSRGAIGESVAASSFQDESKERLVIVSSENSTEELEALQLDQLLHVRGELALQQVGIFSPDAIERKEAGAYFLVKGHEIDTLLFADEMVRKLAQLAGKMNTLGYTWQMHNAIRHQDADMGNDAKEALAV